MSDLEVGLHRTVEEFQFDIDGLMEVLESAYLKDRNRVDDDAWNRKTYPPSGVGYEPGGGLCPRRWYYEFHGNFVRDNERRSIELVSMDRGNESHERIQKWFEDSGILIEAEREIELDSPPIKGKVDLVFEWQGRTVVGEIKTTKQEAFTILKAENKPRTYQLFQLLMYMFILGHRDGLMLYENNNTGEMLLFPVYMTDEMLEAVEHAFDWMVTVKDNEELPTRPYKNKSSGKGCKYCPFRDDCWKDEPGTVTLPLLELPKPPTKSGEDSA